MSRVNMTFSELDKKIDKGEVDTTSLHIPLKLWLQHDMFAYTDVINNIKAVSTKVIGSQFEKFNKDTRHIDIIDDVYYNSSYSKYLPYQDFTGKLYTFSFRCYTGYLTITLSHISVKGRNEDSIIRELKVALQEHFNIPSEYMETFDDYAVLSRIDYKRDYKYHSLEEYMLIRHIINIAPKSIVRNNYKKITLADDEKAFITVYKSKSNKSVEVTIYNKDKEQYQKLQKGKITQEQYYELSDVIRFEVKFKNAKLNQLKYKTGVTKSIDNYKERYTARDYCSTYLEPIFFTETYFRIDVAKNKIKQLNLKYGLEDKLCKLLDSINTYGYTYTREHYDTSNTSKQNYTKFNRHIKKLRELGINPLTFNTTWGDNKTTTYEQICNFTLVENCLEEESVIC